MCRNHNIALSNNGKLYSWGYNYSYQLGNGLKDNVYESKLIKYFDDNNIIITQIASSYWHSYCISNNGDFYKRGSNDWNQQFNQNKDKSNQFPIKIDILSMINNNNNNTLSVTYIIIGDKK